MMVYYKKESLCMPWAWHSSAPACLVYYHSHYSTTTQLNQILQKLGLTWKWLYTTTTSTITIGNWELNVGNISGVTDQILNKQDFDQQQQKQHYYNQQQQQKQKQEQQQIQLQGVSK